MSLGYYGDSEVSALLVIHWTAAKGRHNDTNRWRFVANLIITCTCTSKRREQRARQHCRSVCTLNSCSVL